MHYDPGATQIGEYLVSARSMAEYRAMFSLTDADLRGRILDCPGGGAAFTATACAGGATAIAADPAFLRIAGRRHRCPRGGRGRAHHRLGAG